jgi:hypothetical protein
LEEEMIPVEEAVKRYGITRDGLYYHVRQKNLQTYKVLGDKRAFVKVADMEVLRIRPSAGQKQAIEPDYQPAPEELAELLERIERSDAALARGESISTEQVHAELAQFKEKLRKQRATASGKAIA